jgi:hypothetical protein
MCLVHSLEGTLNVLNVFYMKYLIFLFFIFSYTSLKTANKYSNFSATIDPEHIMLTIPGDPSKSRAVTWRTAYNDTVSIGEIVLLELSPDLEDKAKKVTGTFAPWEEGSTTTMGHRVVFENLIPDTKYAYRVGNGKNWSEWLQIKTSSDKAKPFSFLYLGDFQNDIKSLCSRVVRQAYAHFSDAEFIYFSGDIVGESTEEDWREFFYAGGWIFGTMPSIVTPGNHEYNKNENNVRTFSKHWNQIFTMPSNGPSEKYKNRNYFIDYHGVRFISIDTPAMDYYGDDAKMILNWLENTLENNPNQWAVVLTHFPIYTCSQGRSDNPETSDALRPILEKYGVDIVLQGHDHTYCRGQNLSEAGQNVKNPPMYVVSVSGGKMYGLNTGFWADRFGSNTQLYQNISFSGDTLSYKSFTVDSKLYDDFLLIKEKSGVNRLIESPEVEKIKQRVEIPEKELKKDKYTDDDLKKYRQKFDKTN